MLALASSAWGQPAIVEARRQYTACNEQGEGLVDLAPCRKAFVAINRAMRSAPASLELSVMYGSVESMLERLGYAADSERRFRAAIRARPDWPEPYYQLLKNPSVTPAEQIGLMRQLIRRNPKAEDAYGELITRLSIADDAANNAPEIIRMCAAYRTVVPFDKPSNLETELFAARSLHGLGRVEDAAAILRPIVEHGLISESPISACAELLSENPEVFQAVPEFYARFQRLRLFCTVRDHESAATKLIAAGKLREAAAEFELQIQANPSYPFAFPKLSELYLRMDRRADAVRVLQEFLRRDESRRAKCATLREFGDLERYRVPDDSTVDFALAECKDVK
jgi:tetratricopeptide (TPR) repeat protein